MIQSTKSRHVYLLHYALYEIGTIDIYMARDKQRQKCHQEQALTLVFQGKSTVASAWRDSGLSWAEFLPSATEVKFFQVMFAMMLIYSIIVMPY